MLDKRDSGEVQKLHLTVAGTGRAVLTHTGRATLMPAKGEGDFNGKLESGLNSRRGK